MTAFKRGAWILHKIFHPFDPSFSQSIFEKWPDRLGLKTESGHHRLKLETEAGFAFEFSSDWSVLVAGWRSSTGGCSPLTLGSSKERSSRGDLRDAYHHPSWAWRISSSCVSNLLILQEATKFHLSGSSKVFFKLAFAHHWYFYLRKVIFPPWGELKTTKMKKGVSNSFTHWWLKRYKVPSHNCVCLFSWESFILWLILLGRRVDIADWYGNCFRWWWCKHCWQMIPFLPLHSGLKTSHRRKNLRFWKI